MDAFSKTVERKRKLLDKHKKQLDQLLDQCPHSVVIPKEYYSEGSYYDKASTIYWNECVLCGKRSEVVTETHSWYG